MDYFLFYRTAFPMQLNLPAFEHKLKDDKGKPYIFDVIRKKYVKLDPEEWVRQHFIHYLFSLSYPKSLIQVERGHHYQKLQKRTDIMVYDRAGKPFLLVECKAPGVPLSSATFRQAGIYNRTFEAPYLAITNGLQHYFCGIDFKERKYQFLSALPDFPS